MFYEKLEYADQKYPVICHLDSLNENNPCVNAHWHENYELLMVISGEMRGLIDGRRFRADAGETVIVNSGKMHYLEAGDSPCSYVCLIADTDSLYKRGIRPGRAQFPDVVEDAYVEQLLISIQKEHSEKKVLYQMAVLSLIDQLFIYLVRNHCNDHTSTQTNSENSNHFAVKKAMRYIHIHSSEAMTLDDICRHAGFAKNYFCRLFAEYTGQPPMRYLNHIRCEEARRMLTEGDCTVSEAAARCGIPNVSHFSQYYRKVIGHSPSKDRKRGG